jgi:hypothetical protein
MASSNQNPAIPLTVVAGGINRLRVKGNADKNSLFDLLNAYVTQAGTVKVRPGTYRAANIAAYSAAGATKGLVAYQDYFHVFAISVVAVPPGYQVHVLNHPQQPTAPISEINFAAPYLGGLYVVATFAVTTAIEEEYGATYHYWIQSSQGGDNANTWEANTDYQIGDVVIPTTVNGLTYVASRKNPANPLWTANTVEAEGNVVEPNTANGFQYTVTATLGATPTTGATEPDWPTTDGATVIEDSSLANDQTVTLASAATTPTPTTPIRYRGLYPT